MQKQCIVELGNAVGDAGFVSQSHKYISKVPPLRDCNAPPEHSSHDDAPSEQRCQKPKSNLAATRSHFNAGDSVGSSCYFQAGFVFSASFMRREASLRPAKGLLRMPDARRV